MEEKLISKRELLEKYNISYGSLYRWKRMGLIPDEWFIKKATVTGQETFFHEGTICARIELIISQKDSKSLENLAKEFNPPQRTEQKLTITTPYGKKAFRYDDILSVEISDIDTKDITQLIKDLFK